MQGEEETKKRSNLITKVGARQIVKKFITNKKMVEKIVEKLPDNVMTGHIIYDVMATKYN